MKRQLLLVIGLFLLSSSVIRANELVIEVTTDLWANETSWTLFDTEKNVIKENGSLEKQTTYRDTVQLAPTKCYYWTIYDSYGNGMSNGTPPGNYKIYFDGVLVAECADPDFGYSISVYGLGSNCLDYDVSLDTLTFNSTQAFTPFDLSFNILNFGSVEINTLDVIYTIDGSESESIVLDNLSIEFGELAKLFLPEKLQITDAGSYTIGLQILKINGQDDENPSNNLLIKSIEVKDGYWKRPMHEIFTASTCPPCKSGNEILDGVLELYDSNLYTLVKYQTNFPGSGDPYYTSDVGKMMGLYSIASVPTLFVNYDRQTPHDYTVEKLDNYALVLSDLGIETTAEAVGDSVFVEIKIISKSNQSTDMFLRLSVVEKITYDNVGTNGETEFHNVFMKFLSDMDGDNIGVLEANKEVRFSYATSMSKTFVEEMDDLRIVAYVFKQSSYEIIQSQMVDVPVIPYISFSIDNGDIDIDTLTSIEIKSDLALQNIDGTEITDVSSIISFLINDGSDELVPFTGLISDDKKTITINPNSSLKSGTNFKVELFDVKSDEGVEVVDAIVTFTTVNTVGVNENIFEYFTIYPNPANNFVVITTRDNCEIVVMDITGKIVYTQFLQLGKTTVDISTLKEGMYLISSVIKGESKTIKISKN